MTPAQESLLVTVVTPTRGRPDLVVERALKTALAQTLRPIEVVVVVDGPDPATELALAALQDPRVRVIVLPERQGGAEARNVGVRAARAPWIAFLDDDDEWAPQKLEQQLAIGEAASGQPIVACHWITRTPSGDFPDPARLPAEGEPLGDYMLARRTPLAKTCSLVSTMLFTRRELLLAVPFTSGLPRHQDWDWLLRAAAQPGVQVIIAPGTLAVWYYEEQRDAMSRHTDWRSSLAWAQDHLRRGTLSPRAFVGFINSHVAPAAQQAEAWQAALTLGAALLGARPRLFEVLRYLGNWAFTPGTRRTLRAAASRLLGRLPFRRPPFSRALPLTERP